MSAKSAAKKKGVPVAAAAPISMLRRFDTTLKGADRALLFKAVAERLQTGLLTLDEAKLVSDWFKRIAVGEKPADVLFGERRGRKAGSNGVAFVKGQDVSLPDHVDLCWMIRRAIANTAEPDRIFALVADRYGKSEAYIRKLYDENLPTLGPDPG